MRAVVIVANGWNAGWLGCYGNEWVMTPHTDRLAAEAIVFDQHFATRVGEPFVSSGQLASLRNYGVRTVRVHDLTDERAQPAEGWDESAAVPQQEEVSPGQALFKLAGEKARSLADQDNWLLWVETDRLVPPWSVSLDFFDKYADDITPDDEGADPQPWDEPPAGRVTLGDRDVERLQSTFASVVSEWDAEIGRFVARLRKLELDETALWVITSRHGLALGEHDWAGPPGERPYEEFVHLPLLMRLPRAAGAGRHVGLLTADGNVPATIIEAMGLPPAAGSPGTSFLTLARGEPGPASSYIVQGLRSGEHTEWALRTPEWASFVAPDRPPLLFRKPEDRWEVNDVRQPHLEWAEYLEGLLHESVEAVRAGKPLPPLKEYHEVVEPAADTEEGDEHGATGERDDRPPEGEGGLRGHQGDEED